MPKTTAIGLVSGLLYASSALAQQPFTELTPPTASPKSAAVDNDMQQYIVPHMRIDSAPSLANVPRLNLPTENGGVAHIMPMLSRMSGVSNWADNGPLLYHNGPTVQHPVIYEIYWSPAKLQTGAPTGYSANFTAVNLAVAASYNGHGIGNITTQYGQLTNGKASYPNNDGFLAAAVVDQSPYPASGCNNQTTPGNCLNDTQVEAEITKVVQAQKWQVGLNSIFVLYTSSGEGSCMAANSQECSGVSYCAYHSAIVPQNNDLNSVILYAVIPYPPKGGGCLAPGKSPNNDVDADSAANSFTHEVTEVITNPVADSWYTAQGKEIGDLCAGFYGPNTYANGLANHVWNGFPFELQTEFDNHSQQCVQIGPLYVELSTVTN
jgi:Phosphate-induced protein 1 conserved region